MPPTLLLYALARATPADLVEVFFLFGLPPDHLAPAIRRAVSLVHPANALRYGRQLSDALSTASDAEILAGALAVDLALDPLLAAVNRARASAAIATPKYREAPRA